MFLVNWKIKLTNGVVYQSKNSFCSLHLPNMFHDFSCALDQMVCTVCQSHSLSRFVAPFRPFIPHSCSFSSVVSVWFFFIFFPLYTSAHCWHYPVSRYKINSKLNEKMSKQKVCVLWGFSAILFFSIHSRYRMIFNQLHHVVVWFSRYSMTFPLLNGTNKCGSTLPDSN